MGEAPGRRDWLCIGFDYVLPTARRRQRRERYANSNLSEDLANSIRRPELKRSRAEPCPRLYQFDDLLAQLPFTYDPLRYISGFLRYGISHRHDYCFP